MFRVKFEIEENNNTSAFLAVVVIIGNKLNKIWNFIKALIAFTPKADCDGPIPVCGILHK
jgi:hypothetical protein